MYLFNLASRLMEPYVIRYQKEVINSYIDKCGCYIDAVGFVADMTVLETFQVLEQIGYF